MADLGDSGDDAAVVDATLDAVDETDATSSPCGKGEVLCGNTCFANNVDHCGASCVQCGAPDHGTATCDGTSCGFKCDALQCGSTCVDPTIDTKNCGACGHDCLGTQCGGGACLPQAIYGVTGVQAMTSDAMNLYWIGTGGNSLSIYKGPKTGGTTPVSLGGNLGALPRRKMAVDAQNVYFTIDSYLLSAPIAGGSLGGYPTATTWPTNPTIDAQNVYYGPSGSADSIISQPLDGGPRTPLVAAPVTGVVQRSGSFVYYGTGSSVWRTSASTPDAGTSLLFTADAATSEIGVMSVGPTGDMFFADTVNLFDLGPDGGTTVLLAARVEAIAADTANVYFATSNNGSYTVQRLPIGGSTATVISSGLGIASAVEVDQSFVYYAVYGNQNAGIYRAVK